MTDTEIIKALECCSNEEYNCDNCPLDDSTKCITEKSRLALDLIKRQQEKIEMHLKSR